MADTPKEPPKNFIDALNEQESVKKQAQDKAAELQAINKAGIKNVEATNRTTDAVSKGAADIKAGVTITNPDLAKTGDVASAVEAIHKLNLTTFNTNQGLPQLADNLVKLTVAVQALQKDYESKGVAGLSKQLATLVDKLDGVSKTLSSSKVEVDSGLQKTIDNLQQSISAIEFNPSVNVKAPATKVVTTPINLSAVEAGLKAVVAAVQEQESPETDLSPVISGLADVQHAITSLRFPVPNYVLPFKDVNGEATQVQLDASGNLPTSATISAAGLATSANQTGGNQKTQIVDGAGNVIGATVNALDVNIKSGSSAGTQYAELATTSPGTGTLAVGRYKATPPSLTDGQLYGLQLDTSGNLKVTGSLSVGGTTDNSAFTAGTSTGTPSMGFYHSVIDAVTDGRAAALAIDSKRNLLNVIRDAAGNARGANVTAANELLVSVNNASLAVTGTFWQATQPVSGSVTANIGTTNGLALDATLTGGTAKAIIRGGAKGTTAATDVTSSASGVNHQPLDVAIYDGSGNLKDPTAIRALTSADQITVANASLAVTGTFWQATQPVSGTVTANAGTNLNTSLLALETGGNLASIKTDVDNLNLAQGSTTSGQKGNLTLGAVTTAAPTYTTAQSNPLSLTTAGLLRVDASGTTVPVSGTFWQATQPVSGTVTTTPPANASTNIAQINGVTPLMGAGNGGTGSLRVNIASDQVSVPVAATLAAETTKVIGTVRTADGTGNLYTTNSTTYTAKFAQDSNLLGTLGTAFSTAGKVDVKGADGDVFVRQATGTNLHTVLDSGTLTSITNSVTVTATNLSTNLAQVNGVTTLAGNGVSGTGAQRVTIASDSTGQVAPAANATATGTAIYNNTALSSTKQAVNASAGNLYGYHIYNPNSSVTYIQMWNVASASVTVGTTAPTCVIAVPAGGWADAPPSGPPITFGTALTIAATTTSTGSTAPTTALLCNIWYK